jgi:hypothetical protein
VEPSFFPDFSGFDIERPLAGDDNDSEDEQREAAERASWAVGPKVRTSLTLLSMPRLSIGCQNYDAIFSAARANGVNPQILIPPVVQ